MNNTVLTPSGGSNSICAFSISRIQVLFEVGMGGFLLL